MAEAIAKVGYTHEACIDAIIANPGVRQRDLARMFGYTEGWISQVMSSSAFKARLAERKAELVDPALVNGIEENLEALSLQAIARLRDSLDAQAPPDVALKTLEITTRALGYGAKQGAGVQINQQFVVSAPPKSENGQAWEAEHRPTTL